MQSGRRLRMGGGSGVVRVSRLFLCSVRQAFAVKEAPALGPDQINQILRQEEQSLPIAQDAISYVEVNRLAANEPCEDSFSAAKCGPSGSFLFGVFDGHGGRECSQAIARRLFHYCCASLSTRHVRGYDTWQDAHLEWLTASAVDALPHPSHQQHVARFLDHYIQSTSETTVRRALQRAFLQLDEDMSQDAQNGVYDDEWGMDDQDSALRRVGTGSCACIAHVRGPHLHLANVGDSVAVLGVRQETQAGGSWTARQLTQEHVVDNSQEVQRIRSEHPHSEQESVLRGGRLLGELMPLRAFGDIRYKWNRNQQDRLIGPGYAPAASRTPPYLTALPEVYYHRLTANDRFLIIASDGLWESLTPERVVRLLADHAAGKDTLHPYEPLEAATLDDALAVLRRRKRGESLRPLDANGATHLLRVAVGGSNKADQLGNLSASLSLPPGLAREVRDDITLFVLHFHPEYLASLPPS